MIDINQVLLDLAKQSPVYHSEADFQHSFTWEIHRRLPNAGVRLELPFGGQGRLLHLDVWISNNDPGLAVELKYKTRALETEVQGEAFSLRDQSAQDLGCYDFIKDIVRLEQITANRPSAIGYAILLTNDSAYWNSGTGANTIYAAFRPQEGTTLQGTLAWGEGRIAGNYAW